MQLLECQAQFEEGKAVKCTMDNERLSETFTNTDKLHTGLVSNPYPFGRKPTGAAKASVVLAVNTASHEQSKH